MAKIRTYWRIKRERTGSQPEITNFIGNVLLIEGKLELYKLIIGESNTHLSSANSWIGIGNGDAPEDKNQIGLFGELQVYRLCDSGSPDDPNPVVEWNEIFNEWVITWRATFFENEALFNWREYTLANGSNNSAININRKVHDQGVKPDDAIWTVYLSVALI